VEEIDIWRTPKLLIDAHGQNEWLEASPRADQALDEGTPEGETVLVRVMRAVEALQREKPANGEALN
jgi:hypothetical protein